MTDNTLEVTFDLSMLHPAQTKIARDPHRFRVVCAGRRFGKTMLCSAESIIEGTRGGRVWWVAPTYAIGGIGWRELKRFARQIPGVNIKNSDRMMELPGGGEIWIKSGDDPDNLRGEGLSLLIMEEAAFQRSENWSILRPSLADRRGRAIFPSTPMGHNHFFELWQLGMDTAHNPEWKSFHFPTSSNPHISADELTEIKRTTPQVVWEREFLGEFNDIAGAVFRNVKEALYRGREIYHENHRYVMGVDLAMTNDFSVLTCMDTNTGRVVHIDRFNNVSWSLQRQRIAAMCYRWKVQTAWVESNSIGSVNVEFLQSIGLPVKPFYTTGESKQEIIQGLALAFENGELGLPLNDPNIEPMLQELAAYQAVQLESGRWKYGGAGSSHDDCVMSVALANYGRKHGRQITATVQRYA